ncbi:hypothetical protein ACF0H5_002425 [Mactra antiquata]
MEDISVDTEALSNDMHAASYENDVITDRLQQLEKQIENLEMDKIKHSLRIFGLEEDKDENLSTKINDCVLNVIN